MTAYAHTTTRVCRVLMGLAVLWGIIGLSRAGCWAQDNEFTLAPLQGVQGVQVIIETLDPDIERVGLTKQQLQTDVELRLRLAGIRVMTLQEQVQARTPGKPSSLNLSEFVVGYSWHTYTRVGRDKAPYFHEIGTATGRKYSAFQPVFMRYKLL